MPTKRMVRVNSLFLREISHIIHTDFQAETVTITITEVDITPDLRQGKVFYSVIGDELAVKNARKFFKKFKGRIKYLIGSVITLKYMPDLSFVYDDSMEKGADLLQFMDEVEDHEKPSEENE